MDSNPINEGFSGHIEATDDVEGHMPRIKSGVDGPDTDEVEGHGARFNGLVADDEDDDTEGHGVRVKI